MINWFDVPSESPNKDLTLKNLKVSENGTYGESGVAYSSVEVDVSSGGEGGSSDLNNPIQLELSGTIETDVLVTVLTAGELYELCQTGTPYFTVTQEQNEEYQTHYVANKKYFINEYSTYEDSDITYYDFIFVLLDIVDASVELITTSFSAPQNQSTEHITIGSAK